MRKAVAAAFAAVALVGGASIHMPARSAATNSAIEEDDPRWDCRTMGNQVCGSDKGPIIWFNIGGELQGYELNAPNRPACRVEPSNTREGFEVIFYMDQAKADDDFGFEVRCPTARS